MENKSIDELKHPDWNPRSISEHDFKALMRSMQEFGDLSGVVKNLETGTLVGGNQRLEAFKRLPASQIIITQKLDAPDKWGTVAYGYIQIEGGAKFSYREVQWPLEREKAANIAANRIQGEFDLEKLAQVSYELSQLDNGDELLALTGQTSTELTQLLDSVGVGSSDQSDDEVPAVDDSQPAISQLGEVYQLGPHRLMCGDATSGEATEKLMNNQFAHMVFTDPPWNVAIGLDSNPRHRQRPGLENDNLSAADFEDFVNNFSGIYAKYCTGDLYCVLGASEWPTLDKQLRLNGFHWSATIIWVKDMFVLGRSKYHRRYEPIWYGWHEDAKSSYNDQNRDRDDVWEVPRPRSSEEHPTMKPVTLVEKAIANSSERGDIILDLFGGSGSTLIAADNLDRVCYMMELEPKYCDVIRKRYAQHINQTDWQIATPKIG